MAKKHNNNLNEEELYSAENSENFSKNDSDNVAANESSFDIDALTEEQAKSILKEVLTKSKELSSNFDEVTQKLSVAENEAASNKDKWYRAVAELENFKKRNQDTRKTAYYDGKKDVVLSILIIGDSLDRALAMEMDEKTKEGLMLVHRQFSDTLNSLGVTVINPLDQEFDPATSEAIATVPAKEGEETNKVKTVFKKGYEMDGKIIRYCQVIVTM